MALRYLFSPSNHSTLLKPDVKSFFIQKNFDVPNISGTDVDSTICRGRASKSIYITSKFTHTPYSQPQHGYHSTNIKFKPTCALLCPNVDALWISLTSFFSPCSRYNFFMKRTAQRLLFPSALCKLKLIIYSMSCPKS